MTLTSTEIGYTFLIIIGLLIGFILFLRNYFYRRSVQLANQKSGLGIRIKKHSAVNAFKYRLTNWLFGMACSISLIILLFSYTETEPQTIEYRCLSCWPYWHSIDQEIETKIPRTYYQAVIPSLPIIETLPKEEIEEDIEFLSIETDTTIIDSTTKEEEATPNILETFTRVEFMPTFPGCENISTEKERKKCTETSLLKFIYKNMKYPTITKEDYIEEAIVVSFIINKNGSVIDTKLIRDAGAGLGDELLRVINLMNEMPQKWKPGYIKDTAVNVKYTIPIRVQL